MGRVSNKVALVTGGGSGIGQSACELLAEQGASVVVTDIDFSAAVKTADLIIESGREAIALQHDVSSEEHWEAVIDKALDTFEHLDVLVNNAGIGLGGKCEDISLIDWRKVMSVNLDGAFLGIRAALPEMKHRPSGSIINISSAYGLVGGGVTSYDASKGGVSILTKSVAAECAKLEYKIRVNSVHPGAVDTPMSHLDEDEGINLSNIAEFSKKVPMGRFANPKEIAYGILFLASDESSFMTGSALVIDGGYTAI